MGFSILGTVIAIAMLLPSMIIFTKFPPKHAVVEKSKLPKTFEILEKIGQAGCVASLVISKDYFVIEKINYFTLLMIICIALYYALWIAYAIRGGDFSIMLKPLLFIPLPGAVLPVCAFIFAALWGQCIWLGVSAIVLAAGHCTLSWESYKRIQ
ncbi:hypothetical protein D3C73_822520 [compost metagenome]